MPRITLPVGTLPAMPGKPPARPWVYFFAYLLPATLLLGYYARPFVPGGPFFTVVFAYGLVPLVDGAVSLCSGEEQWLGELSADQARQLDKVKAYRTAVHLWPFLQLGLLAWALTRPLAQMDRVGFWGLAVSMGFVGAGGANVAHELFHKTSRMERMLGRVLLMTIGYGHFIVEHSHGHHKRVGTLEDPATARLHESFYQFWPRAVLGGFRSAWILAGGASVKSEVLQMSVVQVLFACAIYFELGPLAFGLWLVQATVAVTVLEKVNYIEHYGLSRATTATGAYERIGPQHSWDAPQKVTNYLLFKLQRHADHHLNPLKNYQALRGLHASPKLPFGYATSAVLVLVPPLWWRIMDPRAKEARAATI